MATPREERLAENEALFRAANERMAGWEEQHAENEAELYFCECSNPECREKVRLTRAEYERVRSDSRQFALVPGHEVAEIEIVVEANDGWVLIEKKPNVGEVVEKTDPRRN